MFLKSLLTHFEGKKTNAPNVPEIKKTSQDVSVPPMFTFPKDKTCRIVSSRLGFRTIVFWSEEDSMCAAALRKQEP